jgi:glycosyltransferase involved in cell wall biosynthesis
MGWISAQSVESKEELIRLGIPEHKIGVFTHTVKNRFTLTNVFIVLWVGRLIPEKGVDIFLEVARRMKGNNILFLMIGDRELQAENVSVIAGVENNRLPLFYNIADVLLICTKAEELMRTKLEAEACGLKVIQETDVDKIIQDIELASL